MKGAIARAEELIAETPGSWMPQQFENPANVEVHVRTTAREILDGFPRLADRRPDHRRRHRRPHHRLREVLKGEWPGLQVFAVEPTLSPVLSGGDPGPHPIQGIGAGFVPAILDAACSTASSRSIPPTPRRWPAAPPARKACWSASARARRCRRSKQKLAELGKASASSASTTTPASAISRSRTSCRRHEAMQDAAFSPARQALLAGAPAATALAQQPIEQSGTIAHQAAGTGFPERVGGFRRSNATRFDARRPQCSRRATIGSRRGGRVLVTDRRLSGAARRARRARRARMPQPVRSGAGGGHRRQFKDAGRRSSSGAGPALAGADAGARPPLVHALPDHVRKRACRTVPLRGPPLLLCRAATGW